MASSRPNYEACKDKPWFVDTITEDRLKPEAREMLEKRGIPADQVLAHVQDIHDRGFEVFPWPCIAGFSFLELRMSKLRCFPAVLNRLLQNGEKILDLGCALGQNVRFLQSAGVPAENIAGLDLHDGFVTLGYELFNDRDTLNSRFIIADVLEPPQEDLLGKFDIVYAGAFFHVFNWDDQVQACKYIVAVTKARPGTLVFGYQLGMLKAQTRPLALSKTGDVFSHDVESFEKLWEVVGEATGSKWRVDVTSTAQGIDKYRKVDPDIRYLQFKVERL